MLGADGGAAPTEPANERIEDMVARATASGVLVELQRSGEPVDVSSLTDRTAHRVVQESLTNATKHAPRAVVRTRVGPGSCGPIGRAGSCERLR